MWVHSKNSDRRADANELSKEKSGVFGGGFGFFGIRDVVNNF